MLPLPGAIAARIAFALKMAVVCSGSFLAFVVKVTVSLKTMPASRPIPRKPAFLRWLLLEAPTRVRTSAAVFTDRPAPLSRIVRLL